MYISRSNEIGYIRFTRFFNQLKGVMGSESDEVNDQIELAKLVDQILSEFNTCKGLIIDLRDNGGGHSGYELAGRFVSDSARVNYKSIRANGKFSPFQEFWVKPSGSAHFTKAIVILTSDRTASAAEDFTLALSQFSHVTILVRTPKACFPILIHLCCPTRWRYRFLINFTTI